MKGTVVFLGEVESITDKLSKQVFAIKWNKEINGKSFERTLAFEQKKTDKYDSIKHLNGVSVGDEVEVQFNEPESREAKGRWYTSVEAWSVKVNSLPF